MKSNTTASTLYCKRGHQRTFATVVGPSLSGCRKCDKITRDIRYKIPENREKINARTRQCYLKSAYGLSLEAYKLLFVKQYGKCKICYKHQSELDERLSVDHDHKTGKVRGLLCRGCNRLLGYLENSTSIILCRAKEYLNETTV